MTPAKPSHTPPRQMRIPDDQAAKAAGTVRAEAVREFIRWYLRRPGAKLPTRPDRADWAEAPPAN